MIIKDDDVGKYRKRKKSNVSKSRLKSNHKHDEQECLLVYDNRPHYATYRTICGKIHGWKMQCERVDGCYRMLSDEEVFEKYKDLKHFTVYDLWARYLPIAENNDE